MPRPKRSVSPKQLAANRANAAKSTGPRTPQGKARSSQNARKHGFTASTFAVVRPEDLQEIAHLRAELIAVYQPLNSQELFAIERLALTQQAILRAARLESGLFTTCPNEALDSTGNPVIFMDSEVSGNGDIEITRAQNRNYALGEGFHRMVQQSNSWSLALRYQAQAERRYRRAVEEFGRLKALRQEFPNEPVFDPQPEPKESTCTPRNEPVSPAQRPLADARGSDPTRDREGSVACEFSVAPDVFGSTHLSDTTRVKAEPRTAILHSREHCRLGDRKLMESRLARGLPRRDFLAISAATALSAVIPGISQAAPADGEYRNRQPNMTYRRLGRTGIMVSSIGMGGDDIRPDNNDFVLWAVDQGLNYFDTAPNYGNGLSEKGYADVLKARGRDKLFQNTKVNIFPNRSMQYRRVFTSLPDSEQAAIQKRVEEQLASAGVENPDYMGNYFTGQAGSVRSAAIANILSEKYSEKVDAQKQYKQYILDSVEGSLKSLGTDHVDCVLMRGIDTPYEISHTPEIFEAFELLKKQGKARFLGFSAHSDPAGVLNAAIDTGVYSMGMIAYHFLNHKWVGPVLEKAKKADFGVMAMKASRVVQNPFNRRQNIPERVKALDALVPGNMTIFQKGFHWVLQNPNLSGVVTGITNMDMAKEDIPLAFAKA